MLPSLVEPHAQLGAWPTPGQPWTELARQAQAAVARYLASGTTAIRVHVNVGEDDAGLRSLQALLDARAALAGVMDIQLVAVTPTPVTGLAGAAHRARLSRALAAGADLAGIAPAAGEEGGRAAAAVAAVAVVAADARAGLDLQVGDTAPPDTLPFLAALAEAGFGYPVTASHVVSLGPTIRERRRAAQSLAEADIGVVTLPRSGMVANRGGGAARASASLTAMRDLAAAGVPVAAGGGRRRGPGRADPLETACLLLMATRLTPAGALAAVTSAGREIMRLPAVAVIPGAPADLVAIRADDITSAMASGTADRIVLRSGRVVARTQLAAELAVPGLQVLSSAWN